MEGMLKMAHEGLLKSQKKEKHYDCKSKKREFEPGDKVLMLLPSDNNKLLMRWMGPYESLHKVNI